MVSGLPVVIFLWITWLPFPRFTAQLWLYLSICFPFEAPVGLNRLLYKFCQFLQALAVEFVRNALCGQAVDSGRCVL